MPNHLGQRDAEFGKLVQRQEAWNFATASTAKSSARIDNPARGNCRFPQGNSAPARSPSASCWSNFGGRAASRICCRRASDHSLESARICELDCVSGSELWMDDAVFALRSGHGCASRCWRWKDVEIYPLPSLSRRTKSPESLPPMRESRHNFRPRHTTSGGRT